MLDKQRSSIVQDKLCQLMSKLQLLGSGDVLSRGGLQRRGAGCGVEKAACAGVTADAIWL